MDWIDIKQEPPTRCGNICAKLTDGREVLTHAVVAVEGKHRISESFLERLRNSSQFTILADNFVIAAYVYYTHDDREPASVAVYAKDIAGYYYY